MRTDDVDAGVEPIAQGQTPVAHGAFPGVLLRHLGDADLLHDLVHAHRAGRGVVGQKRICAEYYAQILGPANVIGVAQPEAVLETEPASIDGFLLVGLLQRGDHQLARFAGAAGVDMDDGVPVAPVELADQELDLVGAVGPPTVVDHDHLDATDLQHGIANMLLGAKIAIERLQNFVLRHVPQGWPQNDVGANLQLAAPVRLGIGVDLVDRGAHVAHADDAAGVVDGLLGLDRRDLGCAGEIEKIPCLDRQIGLFPPDLAGHVAGAGDQMAGRLAIIVLDDPALGLGGMVGALGDPGLFEGVAVGDDVLARLEDIDRVVGGDLVEIVSGGKPALLEGAAIHARGADPLTLGRGLHAIGNGAQDLFDRLQGGYIDFCVVSQRVETGQHEMHMVVHLTWNDAAAAQINGLCPVARQPANVRILAYGNDLAVENSARFGDGELPIDGNDLAVGQDEIRREFGGHGAHSLLHSRTRKSRTTCL